MTAREHRPGLSKLATALFRICLAAYPRWFRARSGPALLETFHDQMAAARRSGDRAAVVRTAAAECLSVLLHGLRARFTAPRLTASRSTHVARSWIHRGGGGVWQDLRYGVRVLRKQPGFALVAILTLAVGIGANTAVFTVVHAVIFRPLPYDDPDRLVLLWNRSDATGSTGLPVAAPDVAEYRRQARLFEDFAFTNRIGDAALSSDGSPQPVSLGVVTGNFFRVLGVDAALGRVFDPGEGIDLPPNTDDQASGQILPVILSHGLWQRRFGGDPAIIGRTVRINLQPATVVGVLPSSFELSMPPESGVAGAADVWVPLTVALGEFRRPGRLRDRDSDNTGAVIGRLETGVTLEQARAEMDAVAARQRERHASHANAGLGIDVVPMHDGVVGHARPLLFTLLGAVSFVLLIACLNVANLMLARAGGRRREMALRSALGAARTRLIRQSLTESALLAGLGGVAGFALAIWGVDVLQSLQAESVPRVEGLRIHGGVLAVTLGTTVFAALVFGSMPALAVSRQRGNVLRMRGDGMQRRSRLRHGLVMAEVALSLPLLIGAGLMLKSFERLHEVDPGFEADNVLTFDILLRAPNRFQGPAARHRFVTRLEAQIAGLAPVQAVGVVGRLPLGGRRWTQPYGLDGEPEEVWNANEANFRVITGGYFAAMRTRLLQGRFFTPDDDRQDRRVVIVDATMARHIAPDGNAVGRHIGLPLDGQAVRAEVVGVVENVRHDNLHEASRETIYVPYRHEASREISFVVRTTGDPTHLADAVRRELRALAPELPLYQVRTMEAYVADALAPTRFALTLMTVFGVMALFLASVGLYGVISYSVRQRVHEIGIRLALGAQRSRVLWQVAGGGMRLAGAGLALGIGVSLIGTRLVTSLLYEVPPTDFATFAGVSMLLSAVAFLACYLPARQASGVEPMESLREE